MKKEAYLFIIIFSIVIICLSYNYLLSITTGLNMPGDVGSFGSQFGFLNALFSGLAFAVLISTLHTSESQYQITTIGNKTSSKYP